MKARRPVRRRVAASRAAAVASCLSVGLSVVDDEAFLVELLRPLHSLSNRDLPATTSFHRHRPSNLLNISPAFE